MPFNFYRARFAFLHAMVGIMSLPYGMTLCQSQAPLLPVEVQLQYGHEDKVVIARFSKSERYLVTAGKDKRLTLWDLETGHILRQWAIDGTPQGIEFAPDDRSLMSYVYSYAGSVSIWDVASGRLLTEIDRLRLDDHLAIFMPDGRRIVAAMALENIVTSQLALFDVATGASVGRLEGIVERAKRIAVSHDGKLVAAVAEVGYEAATEKSKHAYLYEVVIWDAETGKRIGKRPVRGWVTDLAFEVHTNALLTVNDGSLLRLALAPKAAEDWDVLPINAKDAANQSFADAVLSRDGTHVLGSNNGIVFNPEDGVGKAWQLADAKRPPTTFRKSAKGYIQYAMEISPTGRRAALANHNEINVFDVRDGALIRTLQARDFGGEGGISPDGRVALLLGSGGQLIHWSLDTGAISVRHRAEGETGTLGDVLLSLDGSHVSFRNYDQGQYVWSPVGNVTTKIDAPPGATYSFFSADARWVTDGPLSFSPDGRTFVANGATIERWDSRTGRRLPAFTASTTGSAGQDAEKPTPIVYDARTSSVIRLLTPPPRAATNFLFSPDGRWLVGGNFGRGKYRKGDGSLTLWDAETGQMVWHIEAHEDGLTSLGFTPDSKSIVTSGYGDQSAKIWAGGTGTLQQEIKSDVAKGVYGTAVSTDGRRLAVIRGQGSSVVGQMSSDATAHIDIVDIARNAVACTLRGHTNLAGAVRFGANDSRIITGAHDGTLKIWDARSCRLRATMYPAGRGWLLMTPEGFFSSPGGSNSELVIVRGMTGIEMEQLHQSLYYPDLVREALAGDPSGEVREAAKVINLEKVLDSGPAALIEFASHTAASQSAHDLVTLQARITDQGKGIGRIEWRVNGITAAVSAKPPGVGPDYPLSQQLALDAGDNTVELVAYNASNLLASLPARTTITFTGPADAAKPKLHVLAIGIDGYDDPGFTDADGKSTRFGKLKLAVKDATVLAAELERAGAGHYADVKVRTALDAEATPEKLDALIAAMAKDIHPRDTFILFAAAHGTSERGRFYLIPHGFRSGPDALSRTAIGQDRIQDWVANTIKAKKVLILLDTCESGALVSGHTQSRIDAPASEAAIGRLHEATGRPVLTAAATGKPALEGYNGHGVFTWALLDALKNGDSNGNGTIELSELAAHVQAKVPTLSTELKGARAAIAIGGTTATDSMSERFRQSARFGTRGEDFALVRRLP